uniref:Uncharacterized protein n=1 Tax=Oryza barthii TaxID=65489 RepID=A0A0D3GE11_9ORYZ
MAHPPRRRHTAVALTHVEGDTSAHTAGSPPCTTERGRGVRARRPPLAPHFTPLSLPRLLFFPLFSCPRRLFSSVVVGPSMVVRPQSSAIVATSIQSIISTVCELELEMRCFPISCESFGPCESQLPKVNERIRLHRQPADTQTMLIYHPSFQVQVNIHDFDKQSATFISSATGAITISYIMRICTMCFVQRDRDLGDY